MRPDSYIKRNVLPVIPAAGRENTMNFQQLRYAVEIEKTNSITAAAKNLYMGQPNLSKSIKELEHELGTVLFRRTAKGMEPTASGLQFLRYAKSILGQLDELKALYQPDQAECLRFAELCCQGEAGDGRLETGDGSTDNSYGNMDSMGAL